MRQMLIWGNLIDAEKVSSEGKKAGEEAPALVPASWKLIRKKDTGPPEELAAHVLSFDLLDDGSLVYTNGSAIFYLDATGKHQRLHKDEGIEELIGF